MLSECAFHLSKLILVYTFSIIEAVDKYQDKMTQISHGFDSGSKMVEGLQELSEVKLEKLEIKNINLKGISKMKKLGKVFESVAPFLGALSAVFSILGFGGPSKEEQRIDNLLKVINKGFQRLGKKMDKVKNRLDGLEKEVKREHFWTRLDGDLKRLYEVNARVQLYYNTPNETDQKARLAFFDNYEYSRAYDAFLAIKGTFEGDFGKEPLCQSMIDFSKSDLRRILIVSFNLYTQMIQAATNMAIIKTVITNKTIGSNEMETELTETLLKIKNRIEECEKTIKTKTWRSQWRKEVQDYLAVTHDKGLIGMYILTIYQRNLFYVFL